MDLMNMIKHTMIAFISTQTDISLFVWQLSLILSIIFIAFFMIKIVLFIRKVSLYIDLKVAFMEHILQEISS